jgi:hypothetical protein
MENTSHDRRITMTDYKTGKWARKIQELQKADGSWGYFHSLSMPTSGKPITTEQAINRLGRLGFTKEDEVIQKALAYLHSCLAGEREIPDTREKRMDWDIFIELMLASWIRRFDRSDTLANAVAKKWKTVVTAAFQSGQYDPDAYIQTLYDVFSPKYGTVKRHQELLRVQYYYPVSILAGEIEESIEQAYFDYVMESPTGYYYTYQGSMMQLPEDFCSKKASGYLAAVELYAAYPNRYCKEKLQFVADWLNQSKNADGNWDMGMDAKDGTYFPLSDSWRTAALREKDCTWRIEKLLAAID